MLLIRLTMTLPYTRTVCLVYLESSIVALTSTVLACQQPWVHTLKGRMRREVLGHPSHTPATRSSGGITDMNTWTRWQNDTAEIGQVGIFLRLLRYLSVWLERIIHMLFLPCLCHYYEPLIIASCLIPGGDQPAESGGPTSFGVEDTPLSTIPPVPKAPSPPPTHIRKNKYGDDVYE